MAATITKGVELFGIAEIQPGLLLDPGAQANLEGAVLQRIERAGRQRRQAACPALGDQNKGFIVPNGDDRGRQPDFDSRIRPVQNHVLFTCHAAH